MATRKHKIDLNQATTTDLEKIAGIGPALARRIVAEKPFLRLADLKKVSGIGDKFYAQIRNDLRVPRIQPEAKSEIRQGKTKAPTKQASPPILTPAPKTEPEVEPTPVRIQEKEELASASKLKDATSQVSIAAAPKDENLSKTEPDLEPRPSRIEEKEEPAPASKPKEASPQVSIADAPKVEKLSKTEPEAEPGPRGVREKEEPAPASKLKEASPQVSIPSLPKVEKLSKTEPEAEPGPRGVREKEEPAPTSESREAGPQVSIPSPPKVEKLSNTEPEAEIASSGGKDKEEPAPQSKPKDATPQVSIPATLKVEKLDKTEPKADPVPSRVEEIEESAPPSKPGEATPKVSIPVAPKVEILERPSPPNVSIAIKSRRISPWIYIIAGTLLVTVILVGAVVAARGLRQSGEATSSASDVNIAQVDTATLAATQTKIPETQPSDAVVESTSPPQSSIPATSTTLPPTFTPDTAPAATATVQPSSEPTRAIDAALTEKFTFGSVLWTENFDPPTFNWGRGVTDIATAGYVEGALQAILQTRFQPYWSLGPTYRVSSPNFYYEGVVSLDTCRERDFYGLIFRADGADFYMFAITCDGNFRLLRRLDGAEDILSIAASSGVPLGPGQHRLGVSVHEKQIGLYVAGELIHEYREQRLDQIPHGSFGVYARAVSTDLLKVRWDNLIATEILP